MNLTSEVSLRRFTTMDLEKVMEINKTCLPENYNSYFFMEIFKNCPDAFIVAEVNSTIIGYIMCRIESGFSDFSRIKPVRKGHVVSIAISPNYRRTGIARALMLSAMSSLTSYGSSETFCEVRVTNEPALQLYKKLGFSIRKRISRYYYDGEDAFLMARPLLS
jgi:ribosomal-protein-alanine N-acetyltransferase